MVKVVLLGLGLSAGSEQVFEYLQGFLCLDFIKVGQTIGEGMFLMFESVEGLEHPESFGLDVLLAETFKTVFPDRIKGLLIVGPDFFETVVGLWKLFKKHKIRILPDHPIL